MVSVASTQWQQQRSVERRKGKQHLRRHGIAQEEDESREDISGPDQFGDLQMTQQQQISDVNADFNSWLESYSIAYESSAYASSGEHASSLREAVDPARSPLSLLEASGTMPAATPKGDDETGRSAQPDTQPLEALKQESLADDISRLAGRRQFTRSASETTPELCRTLRLAIALAPSIREPAGAEFRPNVPNHEGLAEVGSLLNHYFTGLPSALLQTDGVDEVSIQ